LNHEFTVRSFTDPFQEIERETTESVPMRDHNFSDSSLDDSVHHSKESLPPKVEPRPDVLDDPVVREVFPGDFLLPLEVVLLFVGRDSAVVDPVPIVGLVGSVSDTGFEVPVVVSLCGDSLNLSRDSPSSERGLRNAVFLENVCGGDIHVDVFIFGQYCFQRSPNAVSPCG